MATRELCLTRRGRGCSATSSTERSVGPHRSREVCMSIRDLSLAPGQFEGLVADVRRMGYTREEAEDAVSDAWITVAEKADKLDDGPIGGYLKGTARFKALKARERRQRQGVVSLDAVVDGDREHEGCGDSLEALTDHRTDAEPVEIIDLEADPITALRLTLIKQGVSGYIMARGITRHLGRYTDEQVACVRALAEQRVSYRKIAEQTGVHPSSVESIVKRRSRITSSMSGWTKPMIEGALRDYQRRHGCTPRVIDTWNNPALPCTRVVCRNYGSWSAGLSAAGLQPRSGGSEEVWTEDRIFEALCSWWHREKRYPTQTELRAAKDHGLPSFQSLRRKLGTQSGKRLIQMTLERCVVVGCVRCAAGATTEGSK
jgi:DNA-directed RNA polymerase specialized sigma24 family protein